MVPAPTPKGRNEANMKMTEARKIATLQIKAAAAKPRYIESLCKAGLVPGEFGLTQWGANELIRHLVTTGQLVRLYDALNIPKYQTK